MFNTYQTLSHQPEIFTGTISCQPGELTCSLDWLADKLFQFQERNMNTVTLGKIGYGLFLWMHYLSSLHNGNLSLSLFWTTWLKGASFEKLTLNIIFPISLLKQMLSFLGFMAVGTSTWSRGTSNSCKQMVKYKFQHGLATPRSWFCGHCSQTTMSSATAKLSQASG